MLTTILKMGGEASCAELARHGDKSAWQYTAPGMDFGKRVCTKCHIPGYKHGDRTVYFVIPFRGRYVNSGNGRKHYVWRLRDALREALADLESSLAIGGQEERE